MGTCVLDTVRLSGVLRGYFGPRAPRGGRWQGLPFSTGHRTSFAPALPRPRAPSRVPESARVPEPGRIAEVLSVPDPPPAMLRGQMLPQGQILRPSLALCAIVRDADTPPDPNGVRGVTDLGSAQR